MNGDAYECRHSARQSLGRSAFHSSFPVVASRQMTCCPPSWSSWRYSLPLNNTGVLCIPNWILNRPYRSWTLNFQTSLPLKSRHASSPVPTKNQTCLPSVDGDADDPFPSSPRAFARPLPTTFRQISLPSVPTHRATSWSRSSPLVRKMWSPQTHGVAPLIPGMGSFQSTFL